MKTFGLKTIIFTAFSLAALIVAYIFVRDEDGFAVAIGFPAALMIPMLINMPLIKINASQVSISTINPFTKNINVQFSEVNKVIVDLDHTMRVVFQMKDGTYKSINTSRYAYDMKPFYYELAKSGIHVVSEGVRTIDWV